MDKASLQVATQGNILEIEDNNAAAAHRIPGIPGHPLGEGSPHVGPVAGGDVPRVQSGVGPVSARRTQGFDPLQVHDVDGDARHLVGGADLRKGAV